MTTEQKAKFPSLPRDGLGLPDLQEWIAFYGGSERQRLDGGNRA
jgi:hypothetical protein